MHAPPPRSNEPDRRALGARFDRALGDEARFIRNWFKNPLVTGAVSPSGRALARMMARYVDPLMEGPVIELGPGTGPVTEALILHGVAPQRLILVEYDGDFCRLLARRFPLARVIQGDAYDLRKTLHGVLRQPASAIVSSLPLLTKLEAQRVILLGEALDLAEPNAPFIQFTYGAKSPVPRRRSSSAFAFTAEASPRVWLNIPPAQVWVYRQAQEISQATPERAPRQKLLRKLRVRGVKARRDLKRAARKLGGKRG